MKKTATLVSVFIIAIVMALPLCFAQSEGVCNGFSIYAILSDDIINFYETEIAGKKVVSDKTQKQIENIANRYDIEENKAKGLLIVYDLCERTGDRVDFPTLAKMRDSQIVQLIKDRARVYEQSLDEVSKSRLKEKCKELLGFAV